VALARTGQRPAAVAWYAKLRRRLRQELGVNPSPELERAYRTVLGENIVIDPPALSEASAAHTPWRGPRPAIEQLIGRDDDLARLREIATSHRLITLTGPVGSGKSALALRLGLALHEEQPGGVAVTELWQARCERDVVAGVDALFNVADDGLQPLLAALGHRQILLILNDVDRTVDGCASVVDAIVRTCPYVTATVTSRETLGLPYEVVWQVGPLPVPSGANADRLDEVLASPAVQLFAQRAAQVRPEFQVTGANASAVASLCRRLDGLPLALEFASACLRTHSLEEVATDAADSLRRLNPRRRGQPAYRRSFHDALRWAYDCLDPAEQRCLSALGAVSPEFCAEAVASVYRNPSTAVALDEIRRLLDRLAEKSFLQVRHRSTGRKYHLLESIRAFAPHLASESALRPSA
jgi:predicted ATPase